MDGYFLFLYLHSVHPCGFCMSIVALCRAIAYLDIFLYTFLNPEQDAGSGDFLVNQAKHRRLF